MSETKYWDKLAILDSIEDYCWDFIKGRKLEIGMDLAVLDLIKSCHYIRNSLRKDDV